MNYNWEQIQLVVREGLELWASELQFQCSNCSDIQCDYFTRFLSSSLGLRKFPSGLKSESKKAILVNFYLQAYNLWRLSKGLYSVDQNICHSNNPCCVRNWNFHLAKIHECDYQYYFYDHYFVASQSAKISNLSMCTQCTFLKKKHGQLSNLCKKWNWECGNHHTCRLSTLHCHGLDAIWSATPLPLDLMSTMAASCFWCPKGECSHHSCPLDNKPGMKSTCIIITVKYS